VIGETLGHYRIVEKIGEGGMGEVYRAHDERLDRDVAIKVLHQDVAQNADRLARFEREAKAVAKLEHPNILAIYDFGTDEEVTYLVAELLEGETLRERLVDGALGWRKAAEIGASIADGLAAAHGAGIIHRDLKPDNVFLTSDGRVKILDFGLARDVEAASADETHSPTVSRYTEPGAVMGTAGYVSPEQVRGEPADHRSDIFSLGCVLHELVCGRRAFSRDTAVETMMAILKEEPSDLRSLAAELPLALTNLVRRCLEKRPESRFQNAQDLAFALRSVLQESSGPIAHTTEDEKSIAVLPFQDMSPGQDQDYFCEGLAEELINGLAQIDGLKVAARTSAFQFKGGVHDVRQIGHTLKVGTVLEGSVRKAGDRLRITTQLVDVATGYHLWSVKFDRDLDDIFVIQDEISLAIVDRLKVKLLGQERTKLVKRHTADRVAHNLYLKGLYFWNRRLEGGMKKAMDFFHQAIEKDPGYALAHVGVADTYNITGFFGFAPPGETFARAKAAAEKALEIDDSMGETHASLAFSAAFFDWDWPRAKELFERAIKLNPRYATAHEWYAIHLFGMGRFEESIKAAERARELDPLSLMINTIVGIAYYFASRYEESIAQHRKSLEMDPNFLLANTYIVLPYVECGMYEDAIDIMRRAEPLATEHTYTLGYFGGVYGRAGREDEALRILARIDELAGERYVSALHRANLLVGLGRFEEALTDMERAYVERCPVNSFSKTIPYFDCLQSNPRYQALMKKIGF